MEETKVGTWERHQHASQIQFADTDVVEIDEWIPAGEFPWSAGNPHNVRPWLLHEGGFTIAVVFASCVQEALDSAVDAGKLDRYQVSGHELSDYDDTDEERDRLTSLGNACKLFDIESLEVVELANPKFSFCQLYAAQFGGKK